MLQAAVDGHLENAPDFGMTVSPDALQPLETARLSLRCVQSSDAADLSGSMTSAVSRWVISWPVPFTLEMATERIDDAQASLASGDMLPFVIERLVDDAFLGWLSVTRVAEHRGLLSYWLAEHSHGYGYMREALAVALPEAFRVFNLDVIEAAAQVGNERSLAVLRDFGMMIVGEKMIFAPARGQDELCVVLELRQPG
jgi:ribosomal-protein-alanine N-acetyltransferase